MSYTGTTFKFLTHCKTFPMGLPSWGPEAHLQLQVHSPPAIRSQILILWRNSDQFSSSDQLLFYVILCTFLNLFGGYYMAALFANLFQNRIFNQSQLSKVERPTRDSWTALHIYIIHERHHPNLIAVANFGAMRPVQQISHYHHYPFAASIHVLVGDIQNYPNPMSLMSKKMGTLSSPMPILKVSSSWSFMVQQSNSDMARYGSQWHRCSGRLGKRPATGRWHWSPGRDPRDPRGSGSGKSSRRLYSVLHSCSSSSSSSSYIYIYTVYIYIYTVYI